MCRLLGIYGQVDFWQQIVMEFRKQAEFGKIPPIKNLEPGHKDGWGMARSNQVKTAMVPVKRQLGSAYNSSDYREALYSIKNQPEVFLCHLRKASPNVPITLSNVHPFFSNGWAFIHNGTIYQAESLPRDRSLILTSDRSDTEHFFHYVLTKILDKHTNKGELEKIADAAKSLKVEYTALNSMLSNGKELLVISSYKKYKDYYMLYYYVLPNGAIVCSEPIESSHLNPNHWKSLTNDSFLRIHGSPPKIDEI